MMPSYPSASLSSSSSSSSAAAAGCDAGGAVVAPSLVFRVGLNGIIPVLVRRQVLLERGWTEFNETQHHPVVHWSSFGFRLNDYASLLPWQRLNHHPNPTVITRKDRLARAMKRMSAIHGPSVYNFSPFAFLLPTDYRRLVAELLATSSSGSSSAAGQHRRRSGTVGGSRRRQRRLGCHLWILKPVDE